MSEEAPKKKKNLTTPILIFLLVAAAFLLGSLWTENRRLDTGEPTSADSNPSPAVAEPAAELPTIIGNFMVSEEEVCEEEGQPLVYYFGASFCPHCSWEHPVMQQAAAQFEGLISFHDNMDSQEDQDVYDRFAAINEGYIPFTIIGCRYVRRGSGETLGEEEETRVLTALICSLTDSQPESVCTPVQDLIDQLDQ